MGLDQPIDFFMENQTMSDVSKSFFGSLSPKEEPLQPEAEFKAEQIYT